MDDIRAISIGSQFLSSTGRIWTVRAITPNGGRFVLAYAGPDGEHDAVMDIVAVQRMVRIDHRQPRSTADVGHAETALPDLTRA